MLYEFPDCGHSFDVDVGSTCPCQLLGKKRSKYRSRAVKDERYGYFHSTGEYKRFLGLLMLEKDGQIKGLERQKRFWLESIKCHAVWDFTYKEVQSDGSEKKIAEDWKGFATAEYKKKRKWFIVEYGSQWEFRETGPLKKPANYKKAKGYKSPRSRHR